MLGDRAETGGKDITIVDNDPRNYNRLFGFYQSILSIKLILVSESRINIPEINILLKRGEVIYYSYLCNFIDFVGTPFYKFYLAIVERGRNTHLSFTFENKYFSSCETLYIKYFLKCPKNRDTNRRSISRSYFTRIK